MLILVINCGSSSAKYQLFDIESKRHIAKGIVERIGEKRSGCENHYESIRIIKDRLLNDGAFVESVSEIKGIGHRVVHGGEEFGEAVIIDKKVIESIEMSSELAPLHNPPSLEGIRACKRYFPGIPQIAVFDTAFHQSIPPHAYIYGIPFIFYKKYKIRRYGFHGTSHRFVANEAARILKKPIRKLKLVTVHLGNGCSMAAVLSGKSVDTTMGFTPLEGLLMGTRSGDLDPAIVTFLMEKEGFGIRRINEILNKESGFLGVSGISNDMRDVLSEMKKGNRRAAVAFEIFVYRIKKYIGAYAAVMGGLDAVVLTGGIGENVTRIKKELSRAFRPVLRGQAKFLIIPTNEELLIAEDTYRLVRNKRLSAEGGSD
ncbi:MAG: acetate kinase [Omnitrophica bacterium RBG_13_46_9]|nr:MAG: acetate kinase [Omnitrophica bacterium RBG_13_46_9]